MKKILSALALALAVGIAAPAITQAAPAPVQIARASSHAKAMKKMAKVMSKKHPSSLAGIADRSIDINSASQTQLMRLPGIGKATARKIIAGRPYKGRHELLKRHILSAAVYGKIKSKLVAKQGATMGKMTKKHKKSKKH